MSPVLLLSLVLTAYEPTLLGDLQKEPAAASVGYLGEAGGKSYLLVGTEAGSEPWVSDGTAAGTLPLGDLRPGSASSTYLQQAVALGDTLLFSANDGVHGDEWWRSDGTPAGTAMVKDLCPGSCSRGGSGASAVMNGSLYYIADDGSHAWQLWKTDGTSAGTGFIAQSTKGQYNYPEVKQLLVFGNTLYWSSSNELWRSDGTPEGTSRVYAVNDSAHSLWLTPFIAAGRLYFVSGYDWYSWALWSTDGTTAGTVRLTGNYQSRMAEDGAQLYFTTVTSSSGNYTTRLYVTNGSSLTLLTTVTSTYAWSNGYLLGKVGTNLLFAFETATTGLELWKTNGTAAGTSMVVDLVPGTGSSGPTAGAVLGGTLYFLANQGTGSALYQSDGTAAGTVPVRTFSAALSTYGTTMKVLGSTLVFTANESATGTELWRSDGTTAGTTLLQDIVPGSGGSSPGQFITSGSRLLFVVMLTDAYGPKEVWSTDGTPSGTLRIKAVTPSAWGARASGGAYLMGAEGSQVKLWFLDGATAEPPPVKVLRDSTNDSAPSELVSAGVGVYFRASDATGTSSVWWTDGTPAGTAELRSFNTSTGEPSRFVPLGANLFFRQGSQLYVSDGTDWGTNYLPGGSYLITHEVLGDKVLSIERAVTTSQGFELWRHDETTKGAVKLGNVQSWTNYWPGDFARVGSMLLFPRYYGVTYSERWELWRTNGTWTGTVKVTNLPGDVDLLSAGTQAFFTYSNALWRTDGTATGTVQLAATTGTAPQDFHVVGNRLFFTGTDSTHGREPWISDGTPEGTHLLVDFVPGATSSVLLDAVEHQGVTYLLLQDTENTWLVRTDGTSTGTTRVLPAPGASWLSSYGGAVLLATADAAVGLELRAYLPGRDSLRLVSDINPGPAPSTPGRPVRAGNRLVFAASRPDVGQEPFSLALDTTGPTVTSHVTGTLGDHGYYVGDVTVEFDLRDNDSGDVSGSAGCAPSVLRTDTAGQTIECIAYSLGGVTRAAVTLQRDTTAPELTCPASFAVEQGQAASFAVTVTDAVDAAPTWTSTVAPGAVLPVGEHPVQVTAKDAAGNSASCGFTVTVTALVDSGGGTDGGVTDGGGGTGPADGGTGNGGTGDGGLGGGDAGGGGAPDAGAVNDGGGSQVATGCGCQSSGSAPSTLLGLLAVLVLSRRRGGSRVWKALGALLLLAACGSTEGALEPRLTTEGAALTTPSVSGEYVIEPPLRTGMTGLHTGPEVAYSPVDNVFLTVWTTDTSIGSYPYDLYAARIRPDGTPLDAGGLSIGSKTGNQLTPRAVFDGVNFLVVWRDYNGSTSKLLGARVTPGGQVLDPSGFVISSGGTYNSPSVASDGTTSLVVWEDTGALKGARIQQDTTVVDKTPLVIAAYASVSKWSPSIAAGGGVFLVAFEEYSSATSTDISCKTVTADGVVSASSTRLVTEANDQKSPSVAFDGTNFLVAWQDNRTDYYDTNIYARRVAPDGTAIDASAFPISTATGSQEAPAVAFDGTHYQVAWSDKRSGTSYDLYASRVGVDGTVLDPSGFVICSVSDDQVQPALASTGNGLMALWQDHRGTTYYTPSKHIYASPVAVDGTVAIPSGARVTFQVQPQGETVVGFDGTHYLVIWSDAQSYQLYFTRFGLDGTRLDASRLPLVTGVSSSQQSPAVTFNGKNFVVVWKDWRTSGQGAGLYATTITPDGAVVYPSGIAVNTTASGQANNPAIACNDASLCLIAWSDTRSGSESDIYGTLLESNYGGVSSTSGFLISGANWNQYFPSVASDGKDFFAVWEDWRRGTPQAAGARIKADGTVLDPQGLRMKASTGSQYAPRVISGGPSYLVVWQEVGTPATEADVVGVRVGLDGVVLDASALPIGAASLRQQAPDVAFDGLQYLVTWTDGRSGNDDILAARVGLDGTLLDAPGVLSIATADSNETRSRVAAARGLAGVLYTRFDATSTVRADQMRLRLVSGLASGGFNGVACSSGTECLSGLCVDGVCCNTPCGGSDATDCQACSRAAGGAVDGRCSLVKDYTSCDDKNLCSSSSYCRAGACVASYIPSCPYPDACHEQGVCNPSSGTCDPGVPKANGTPCYGGTCQAGVCTPTPVERDAGTPPPTDGGTLDGGGSDAGSGMDGGTQDGGSDAGTPSRPDGGDAGVTPAPSPQTPPAAQGCGCQSTGAPDFLLGLLAFTLLGRRRLVR